MLFFIANYFDSRFTDWDAKEICGFAICGFAICGLIIYKFKDLWTGTPQKFAVLGLLNELNNLRICVPTFETMKKIFTSPLSLLSIGAQCYMYLYALPKSGIDVCIM